MKRLPVTLFIEEAPVDPFEPKGEQQYRLVAAIPSRETEVILSEAHGSVLEAMLDAWNDGIGAKVDDLKGRTDRQFIDHDRLLGSLGKSIRLHARQIDTMRRIHRAMFKWSGDVAGRLGSKRNPLAAVEDRVLTDDADWWWEPSK